MRPLKPSMGPSPTLAGPCQARHELAFGKNGYLQPKLGPFKLERGSLMTAMGSLIPHIGLFMPAQGPLKSFSSLFSQLLFF